ncbi:MAG: DUF2232 domain-containing protein [Desulfobulbaceae bacterium]|uniref:DUF2232 domain-containing protein n=1 Tax=Candidatus Desulfatifera sulfidica TaxID=2841691 RepID=A0A8J6N9N4_9BACT|nr:DUF2232 domain-containing protein [Candidatus Desulfatifera sulfidica]
MKQVEEQPYGPMIIAKIVLISFAILVPAILGPAFSWVHVLLPLLVFYYLCHSDVESGRRHVLYGTALGLIVAVFSGIIGPALFSLTMIPAGFTLASAVAREESPALAGLRTTLVLGASWFVFAAIIGMANGNHPYTLYLASLDQGFDEILDQYKSTGNMPQETLYLLEQTFAQFKYWLPRLMPSLLASITLFVAWLVMILGNQLLSRGSGVGPWPNYKYWQLPDRLVWLVISGALLALIPIESFRTTGLNILVVASVIYCFQGLAVVLFLFQKWKVPVMMRMVLITIIVLQSLGTVVLAGVGLADVWLDLRKMQPPKQPDTKDIT